MNIALGERDFQTAFKSFIRTVKLSCKISRLGANRILDEDRIFWASVLFTRMCVIALSIQLLNTHNIPEKFIPDNWDYASTFSLTRNLMECFHTLFYLCFDDIPDEERIARRQIFNLHDIYAREELFSVYNQETPEDLVEKQKILNEIIECLKTNSYFQSLPEKQREHYLKGKQAFLLSREEIEERSGRDKQLFKFMYKLFSSNTHTFPMGFYRMIDRDRGTGAKTETEELYATYAINFAEGYLISATQKMFEFYPDLLDKISPQERRFIGYE